MNITPNEILFWVNALIWPFVRISALLSVAPVFGTRHVNLRTRLALGLLLAVIVATQMNSPPPSVDPLSINGLLIAMKEILLGITMGFILQLVFSALIQAGESIALSMGLGFASAIDPVGGVQVPVLSQYFLILATLIFLALNGHLVLIELLLRSFTSFPIIESNLNSDDLWSIVRFGNTMFAGALLIALPAVAALLLVNIAMGVVTRAAPQLNLFAIGFPLTLLAGLVFLILMLPAFPARIGELLITAFSLIQNLLKV